jgi:hypothetical protein
MRQRGRIKEAEGRDVEGKSAAYLYNTASQEIVIVC